MRVDSTELSLKYPAGVIRASDHGGLGMHIQWPSRTREGVLGTDHAGQGMHEAAAESHARPGCPTTVRANFRPSNAQPRRPRRPGRTDVLPGARAVPAPSAYTDGSLTQVKRSKQKAASATQGEAGARSGLPVVSRYVAVELPAPTPSKCRSTNTGHQDGGRSETTTSP